MTKEAIHLYRSLLRASRRFADYNYRAYAVRRTKEEFHKHQALDIQTNQGLIKQHMDKGYSMLRLIERQAVMGQMYAWDPLVLERPHETVVRE
mmetsp:Transcript_9530/g.16508  ORF Transcript_9530/g.16508 Transcript_9530/m.16508 type:complete len:93 (-) Transcript_9530:52-330(-)|eukprot:CAMPEP_0184691830 /NCGR_PEP_ID=MMETSP0313-20130426/552_1 /TAXON_ID=2792 /ORGANISM="Porphyridium aerugineum, Strain SAG 1380-2" /LENGTH=92 /DNA_ID=CAMNT_0027149595 /DNA_START=203 /DNA_END=481 /DNA_ORIENTATION=-